MLLTMLRVVCLLALIACAFARNPYYVAPQYNEDGSRIVNGTDAPPGKYPFMVSYQGNNRHSCGGSILNAEWVLTAGHCVEGDSVNSISIYSGSVDLNSGGQRRAAAELILHESYSSLLLSNDIALVRVAVPFVFDSMHTTVTLPAAGQQTPGGSNATLVGWGLPYTGGSVMQFLQEVDYWVVTDDECRAAHSSVVFDSNICAYYPGGVLTEVSYFIDWINAHINA
ncbi:hypothetical protein B566_EDAN006931 [Ephemera danica]|nr:hypothetical protein B566_EDAN006931 [Ephemera danica]